MPRPTAPLRLAPMAAVLIGVVALFGIGMGALRERPLGKETRDMDEGQPVRLEAGLPVERRIQGGTAHRYLLALEPGQYVRVAAEQRGIDILLRLSGPDGATLAEVDGPTGGRGFERVSEVASIAGEYRLEVSAEETKETEAGDYAIRIEDLRPATGRDRRLVAAERVFTEADILRRGKELEEALARYRQVLEVRERDGGPGDQAQALYRIGWVLQTLDRWQEAEGFFDRAVEASRAAGDRALEAVVLNRRGTMLRLLGRYDDSRASHEQALEAFRANDNVKGERDALNSLGNAHLWAGRIQAAVEAYDRARALSRDLGDREAEGVILTNLGEVYLSQGKLPEARDAFDGALGIARERGSDESAAFALLGLGDIAGREKRFDEARERLGEALDLQRRLDDRRGQAITLNLLGTTLLKSGDLAGSGERYAQALALFRELGDLQGEATVLIGLAHLEEARGDSRTAAVRYGEAQDLFERLRDRHGLAMARFGGARALARQGDLESARDLLEASLGSIESLRVESQSLSLRTSYFASKQHYWELYIDVLMGLQAKTKNGSFAARALQAAERRRFRGLLDALAETRADVRSGIAPAHLAEERAVRQRLDRIERLRLDAVEAGGDPERIEALERESRDLLARLDRVRARIRQESPRFADLVQPETVSLDDIQKRLLGPDDLLLVYSLGEDRGFVWAVSAQSFTFAELAGRKRIEGAAERLHELLTRSSQRARSARRPAAEEVAELVLAPVADRLRNFGRLLVVADGALQKIPFAALPLPGKGGQQQLVLERHETVMLPSASVLATLRRETGRPRPRLRLESPLVAVVADPVFQEGDERVRSGGAPASAEAIRDSGLRAATRDLGLSALKRLSHTRREADAIVRWIDRERDRAVFLDFAADRSLLTNGNLKRFRVLHFATHSVINDRQPELSGLVFSLVGPDGRPREGFLRLHEIYNLDLEADLVVLSACQTGVGREIRGEGLAGVVRGFMHAGVPGILVSLWNVDDAATAELMSRFYKHLLEDGQKPPAALRSAQLSMLRDPAWKDTELWAGFVFLGDPVVKPGGGLEEEDTGGVEPAKKADHDLPPPKIAPDDEPPVLVPRDREREI